MVSPTSCVSNTVAHGGDNVTYRITMKNNGSQPAYGVNLNDTFDLSKFSGAVTCTPNTGNGTCTLSGSSGSGINLNTFGDIFSRSGFISNLLDPGVIMDNTMKQTLLMVLLKMVICNLGRFHKT